MNRRTVLTLILLTAPCLAAPLQGQVTREKGDTIETLRTPVARFEDLPGYSFDPHYAELEGLRVHYVDEGPRSADPVVLLHGEPSWSYLYRTMIPILVERVTLFAQDWGGLIGLRLVAEHPDRFARVVAANTGLPTGEESFSEAFLEWQQFSQQVEELPIARILQSATVDTLPPDVLRAYEAPFPDERYEAGARMLPGAGADLARRA